MRMITMGKIRNVYRILVGKPERKRSVQRCRHRWEDKLYLKEIRYEVVHLIYLVQDRDQQRDHVTTALNLQVLKGKISGPAEQLLASQEELCSMELIS
jgi:hypothetical protein